MCSYHRFVPLDKISSRSAGTGRGHGTTSQDDSSIHDDGGDAFRILMRLLKRRGAAQCLQRVDVDLREGGERLDDIAQYVEPDAGADNRCGLLQPLTGLRAEWLKRYRSLAKYIGTEFAVRPNKQKAAAASAGSARQ